MFDEVKDRILEMTAQDLLQVEEDRCFELAKEILLNEVKKIDLLARSNELDKLFHNGDVAGFSEVASRYEKQDKKLAYLCCTMAVRFSEVFSDCVNKKPIDKQGE